MLICGDALNVCRPPRVVQAEDEVTEVGHSGQVWAPWQMQLEGHQVGGQPEKPFKPLRPLKMPEIMQGRLS